MKGGLRWRAGSILALIGIFGFLVVANFVPKEQRVQSGLWPDDGLRLGLDLQGGIHWVVGVDLAAAITHELEFLRDGVRTRLTEEAVVPARAAVEADQLVLKASLADDVGKLKKAVSESGVLDLVAEADGELRYALSPAWVKEIRERTMLQVLEVLRRRIDDPIKGIPESVVTRQGSDRVKVEIPGGQIDRGRARDLLKSTGFLEFKIVLARADSEAALRTQVGEPNEEQQIVVEKEKESGRIVAAYLVRKTADITGDYLSDARVGFDPQQRPLVNFQFNSEGARIFGELTGNNLRKGLAIILDGNVYSAPVIQSRISDRGQITGRFSPDEAADLSVVLRAGALSVPVMIEEERSVGPTLGQDSIDAGLRASIAGLLAVLVFAVGYYRLSGCYGGFAVLTNILLLVGIMSLFEATLTMPGIAGLVLTVGMAIDANVIIFERIREELRAGKTPRSAIATGFNKSTWTVLDANLTTLITGLILFQYGTGPIKGFAVTLSIGILTSVFTALVVTRILYEIYPGGRNVEQLSI